MSARSSRLTAGPAAGLTMWTWLHSVAPLELAGHFTAMGFGPGFLFEAEAESTWRQDSGA
ncbi:hypothetical protein ODJ79_32190 [Actinoplanes sp. KI2]|uniref:hypothetical protein n=1 Tax=Actinoplanes sp. KI2 TaxID=2983315 RepID=UPI0021D60513|nr:hypothetical protein [Actinoplanes sp. KI2]MCU7728395.1 hypothetical protein [Actinoplanes sp. KI2]